MARFSKFIMETVHSIIRFSPRIVCLSYSLHSTSICSLFIREDSRPWSGQSYSLLIFLLTLCFPRTLKANEEIQDTWALGLTCRPHCLLSISGYHEHREGEMWAIKRVWVIWHWSCQAITLWFPRFSLPDCEKHGIITHPSGHYPKVLRPSLCTICWT